MGKRRMRKSLKGGDGSAWHYAQQQVGDFTTQMNNLSSSGSLVRLHLGGKRRRKSTRRGGGLISSAAVPLTLFAAQQAFSRRYKGKGTRKNKTRRRR
jgi:hypothetical protein